VSIVCAVVAFELRTLTTSLHHSFCFGSSRLAARRPALRLFLFHPPEWEDESPYPEVRSAVSNTDDMEMPVDTLRVWTIGLLWSILIPGLNQFLFFRYPSIQIGSVRDLFFFIP